MVIIVTMYSMPHLTFFVMCDWWKFFFVSCSNFENCKNNEQTYDGQVTCILSLHITMKFEKYSCNVIDQNAYHVVLKVWIKNEMKIHKNTQT